MHILIVKAVVSSQVCQIKKIKFWAMNFNTITSELFTKAFNTWWGKWKNEIERFRNIQEWWMLQRLKLNI